MRIRFFIIIGLISIAGLFAISPAYALESDPLIAKNTDGVSVFSGVVGQPIIFESIITNNEEDTRNFEIAFSTRNMDDKILDHQIQSISLKSDETITVSYQFVPPEEGNYVSDISYGVVRLIADKITFSALDDGKTYSKKTVVIYSDSSDDCLVACMDPSVVSVDVGTVVELHNITPDTRRISTGIYMDGKDGGSWSSDDRFHTMVASDRKSSFLFSQPGQYQLFLAEHRSSDVIGTIHVMSDEFREADKTSNILNQIMNDKDSGIPVSSLYINPKNSVITVGINDKHNPLFTLDVYKTMIYKQVGNVYLDIISDHDSFKTGLCDVNDKVAVKAMLDKDPVVKQFLQHYPSATFEHFKTGDEPGNPRTYSEFHHGNFLLRVLVLTYDQNDVCYPVYGYVVDYDDPSSVSKGLFEDMHVKSDGVSKPIIEIKKLSKPTNQIKSGMSADEIQCKDDLVLLQKYDGSPACVKESTKEKLIERGWTSVDINHMLSSRYTGISDVEKLLVENKIDYLQDKLVVTSGIHLRGDPGCGGVMDSDFNVHWFGINSISAPTEIRLYSENPQQCKVNTSSCFCNAQMELAALTLDELNYFTIKEQEEYANILIDYMYDENINRTPKFMIGQHNVNYTNPSAVGYCGKIWGTNTYGYFNGAIINGKVEDYKISKELPLLCAISDDSQYFGKMFGELKNEN
ncbi:MAG: hypothetical protein ACW9W4_01045 [Candidatus Nitrosopumilus sp. bin_7KS]